MGIRARVKLEAVGLGLGLTAYLNGRLEKHTERPKRDAPACRFDPRCGMRGFDGRHGLLLNVVVQYITHHNRSIMDTLPKHSGVRDCKIRFVLERAEATTAMPA